MTWVLKAISFYFWLHWSVRVKKNMQQKGIHKYHKLGWIDNTASSYSFHWQSDFTCHPGIGIVLGSSRWWNPWGLWPSMRLIQWMRQWRRGSLSVGGSRSQGMVTNMLPQNGSTGLITGEDQFPEAFTAAPCLRPAGVALFCERATPKKYHPHMVNGPGAFRWGWRLEHGPMVHACRWSLKAVILVWNRWQIRRQPRSALQFKSTQAPIDPLIHFRQATQEFIALARSSEACVSEFYCSHVARAPWTDIGKSSWWVLKMGFSWLFEGLGRSTLPVEWCISSYKAFWSALNLHESASLQSEWLGMT